MKSDRFSRRSILKRLGLSTAMLPLIHAERAHAALSSGFPRRFGDRYVLLKELGQGGMGRVYMADTGEPGAPTLAVWAWPEPP